MTAAVALMAIALLVMPPPVGRRRFSALFSDRAPVRKLPSRWMFRVVAGIGVPGAALAGMGSLVAFAIVVVTLGLRLRRVRQDRCRDAECAALLEALEVVIGELRVGAHPSVAAAVAAGEVEGVAARLLAVCSARSRLGGAAADGLRDPAAIIAVELSRIADVWQLAEQYGLALAELLVAARTDLFGRIRFRDRTAAALAGARASATVLAGLPLLGITLGQLMGAAPLRVLLGSGAGTVLLPLGAGLVCAGLLWTDVITRGVQA